MHNIWPLKITHLQNKQTTNREKGRSIDQQVDRQTDISDIIVLNITCTVRFKVRLRINI